MIAKKSLAMLAATALFGMTLLSGCGKTEQSGETNTNQGVSASSTSSPGTNASSATDEKIVKNVWGETKVKGTPSKIVALDFFIVDTLVSLGVTPTGIAGTEATRVPDYLKSQVTSFTDVGERKSPNLEVIQSIKPDLIIANPERAKTIKTDLENIAPTIALSDKTYKDILSNVDTLGELLGKQEQAKKVREDFENKIKSAKEKVKNNPSALLIGAFEDELSVWVAESFIGTIFTDIGVKYVYDGAKQNSEGKADIAKLTIERLSELNPDFLFVYGDSVKKLESNPLFKSLKAVKENHYVKVEQDLWSRARGPIAASLIIDQALPVLTGEKK